MLYYNIEPKSARYFDAYSLSFEYVIYERYVYRNFLLNYDHRPWIKIDDVNELMNLLNLSKIESNKFRYRLWSENQWEIEYSNKINIDILNKVHEFEELYNLEFACSYKKYVVDESCDFLKKEILNLI